MTDDLAKVVNITDLVRSGFMKPPKEMYSFSGVTSLTVIDVESLNRKTEDIIKLMGQ